MSIHERTCCVQVIFMAQMHDQRLGSHMHLFAHFALSFCLRSRSAL